MEYLAHIDGDREQSVKEHLQGTAELAEKFAAKFRKADWGYCCGMLHDIGKYSVEFQKKIKENLDIRVDHSTAGAKVCENLDGCYWLLTYCIAGHHAGLPDLGREGLPSSLLGRLKKRLCDYSAYEKEIEIPQITTPPIAMNPEKDPNFALSVFIRMLAKAGRYRRCAGHGHYLLSHQRQPAQPLYPPGGGTDLTDKKLPLRGKTSPAPGEDVAQRQKGESGNAVRH